MAFALARRNVLTRYNQTILGPAWYVIQPIMLTGALSLVFGLFLHVPSDGVPYLVFAGTGTVLWTVFTRTLFETMNSLAVAGPIMGKVYFPRILIPTSGLMAATVDFVPIFCVLLLIIAAYRLLPGWHILAIPAFVILLLLFAYGLGLWLTVMDSYYRDVHLFVPYILQFVFFLTPIMYGSAVVPERYQAVFRLNPLIPLMKGFRWTLIEGAPAPSPWEIIMAGAVSAIFLITGMMFFARHEQLVVDRI
jgi:lipopolysaccharide transport system permease protein